MELGRLQLMASPDKQFLNFSVDKELLKRIEDFRFKNRFQTKSAAIKWLLVFALDQKPKPPSQEDV